MIRNEFSNRINYLVSLVMLLPFFSIDQLSGIEKNQNYRRVLLSRYEKKGTLIRLKKGLYVSRSYLDSVEKGHDLEAYLEFIAGILYRPSYLSFEYVLYQHQLLTEIPTNFTCASTNKTLQIKNNIGHFYYHSLKTELFTGYQTIFHNNWVLYKASKAKALFDYLYIRKNYLINLETLEELRLNLRELTQKDKKEIEKYNKIVSSKKMSWILKELL